MKPAIHFQRTLKMVHGAPGLRIQDLRIYERECAAFYGLPRDLADMIINHITGVYPPEEGTVYIYGADSRAIPEKYWFDFVGDFGIYSSTAPFVENASVGENLATLFRSNDSTIEEPRLSSSVLRLANMVHLTITDLSKIMQEATNLLRMKVRLARALALRPKLVILHEPTGELSRHIAQKLLNLVKSTRRKLRYTLVIFTSDLWLLQEIAERVVFLNPHSGTVVENKLRVWYHNVLPFLKPSRAKRLQLARDIRKYGRIKDARV